MTRRRLEQKVYRPAYRPRTTPPLRARPVRGASLRPEVVAPRLHCPAPHRTARASLRRPSSPRQYPETVTTTILACTRTGPRHVTRPARRESQSANSSNLSCVRGALREPRHALPVPASPTRLRAQAMQRPEAGRTQGGRSRSSQAAEAPATARLRLQYSGVGVATFDRKILNPRPHSSSPVGNRSPSQVRAVTVINRGCFVLFINRAGTHMTLRSVSASCVLGTVPVAGPERAPFPRAHAGPHPAPRPRVTCGTVSSRRAGGQGGARRAPASFKTRRCR